MASNKYVDLRKTEKFVMIKCYSEDIPKDKAKKSNVRKSLKNFKVVDWHLKYKEERSAIFDSDTKRIVTHDVNEVLGDKPKANALAAHCKLESTYQKLAERFYGHSMVEDVKEYIKTYQNCQHQRKFKKKKKNQITKCINVQ